MRKKRIARGVTTVLLAGLLMVWTTPRALAAFEGDTPLGDYSAAPYRDVVRFVESYGVRYVEIPEEYIFNPDLLDRKVVVGGREWQDLVLVMCMEDQTGETLDLKYYVYDLMEDTKWWAKWFLETVYADWMQELTPDERREKENEMYNFVVDQMFGMHVGQMVTYPLEERFVSINGRPWQETEWRDLILEKVRALPEYAWLLSDNKLWSIFMNPAYNGRAAEVFFGLVDEAGAEGPTEPSPTTGVEIESQPSSDSQGAEQPVTETQETAPEPAEGLPVVAGEAEANGTGADSAGDEGEKERPAPVKAGAETEVHTSLNQVVLSLGGAEVVQYRNGRVDVVQLSRPIAAVDGVTMVPLKGVLDSLGAQVSQWKTTIVITAGEDVLVLQEGSAEALLNGAPIQLQKPVIKEDGRTLIPLRSIAEALGYQVLWDPLTKQVIVRN